MLVIEKKIMNTAEIRGQIHEYIERADERMLRIIHSIVKGDVEQEPTEAQKQELDRRIEKIDQGKAKFYTMDEVENWLSKYL